MVDAESQSQAAVLLRPQGHPLTASRSAGVRRVLVVANSYPDEARPYYGPFVRSEVEALRREGVEVDVLVVRGYLGKGQYIKGGLRALALNRGASYDVVHAYYGFMGLLARLQLRSPLVVSFTGGDIQGDRDATGRLTRWGRFDTKLSRAAARVAGATTTQTQAMEDLLPASCRPRNRVIPTGVDLSRFGQLSRAVARARLGWEPDEPTVIFVARPEREVKNFPLAAAAIERLRESVPDVRLRVAATVPPAEIPIWMAAADALLLTSRSEGSPNAIKEAMAAELPAVSTPVGDVPERFEGVPGCWVRPPEPSSLAEALVKALGHGRTPEAREAVAVLDVRRTVEQVLEVYESVAGARRSRA